MTAVSRRRSEEKRAVHPPRAADGARDLFAPSAETEPAEAALQDGPDGLAEAESAPPAPLAWRMRPRSFEDFVGQAHLVGPASLLRRAVETERFASLIFYGPPGSGKTALAGVIANTVGAAFVPLNAVTAGVADLRAAIRDANLRWRTSRRRTILFIDEIHRFNRAQQDALLPDVERGTVILIGASTQNPFFAVIPALASRSLVYELKPLGDEEIETIVDRALADRERGLGTIAVRLTPEARGFVVRSSGGDARRALNALEMATAVAPPDSEGTLVIDRAVLEEIFQKKAVVYDSGDPHYDTASAFIKSLRGSDPDAAIYWMAKMIVGGEDPLFIARRLVISAAEDVGNADPRALQVAVAAFHAVKEIGMPEGRIPLAQAAAYIACAPKSNAAYAAIDAALSEIETGRVLAVPPHLRDASYRSAARLGAGKGYVYPHDAPGHAARQDYLPESRFYYFPSDQGEEEEIGKRLKHLRRIVRGEAPRDSGGEEG